MLANDFFLLREDIMIFEYSLLIDRDFFDSGFFLQLSDSGDDWRLPFFYMSLRKSPISRSFHDQYFDAAILVLVERDRTV